MNSIINIQLIILILINLNECSQIKLVKKEINKLKENFEHVGKSIDTKITEYKEEVKKGNFLLLYLKRIPLFQILNFIFPFFFRYKNIIFLKIINYFGRFCG